jgi:hypothetical protein
MVQVTQKIIHTVITLSHSEFYHHIPDQLLLVGTDSNTIWPRLAKGTGF